MKDLNLLDDVEIHSISWSEGDRVMTYHVGQSVQIGSPRKQCEVIRIDRDETHYHLFGNILYKIFLRVGDDDRLWRYIENKPVHVVCKL